MAARKATTQKAALAADQAEPEKIGPGKPPLPQTPQEMAEAMAEKGLPESVIIAALNAQFGGGDGQGPAPQVPGRSGGTELGPDPKMVAAYEARMKDYVPSRTKFNFGALRAEDPKLREVLTKVARDWALEDGSSAIDQLLDALDGFGGVELPEMFMRWCVQWQYWQMTLRKLPQGEVFPEAKVLEDMVRYHWHAHPQERARLQAAQGGAMTSGPAKIFNPGSGGWDRP